MDCQTVFQCSCTILHSHQKFVRISSMFSTTPVLIYLFDYSLPNGHELVPHGVLVCISLTKDEGQAPFHVFVGCVLIFSGEVSMLILHPLFNWGFVFLLLSFKSFFSLKNFYLGIVDIILISGVKPNSSLYILYTRSLSDVWFVQIFYPIAVGCISTSSCLLIQNIYILSDWI